MEKYTHVMSAKVNNGAFPPGKLLVESGGIQLLHKTN